MMDLIDLGESIAAARKEKRLSQTEVARRAGVSRSTIDLLENGRGHEIGFSKASRLATAVGLELTLRAARSERPTLDDLLRESADD
jgi:transcriptional regulator with XRE-family HTH domain